MQALSINSIYRASEGEGVFVGTPQVFVRFQGCAIGCLNCDSRDTWDFDGGRKVAMDEVLAQVSRQARGLKRVSITGGDPLHPKLAPQVLALVKELKQRRYYINIEAAGMRLDHQIFDLVDFISFDFKTPSTGVKTPLKNLATLMEHYPGKFQVKAVIENKDDFLATQQACDYFSDGPLERGPWCLTPAYNLGEDFPRQRILDMIEWNELSGGHFRVITQQHKVFYGPDRKQV